ncbi:G-protein alpha subunit-domain-containing protein [Flagelloscypha sp. PMI_526]|nr:G-protein alpha subunit-domain-containing protein [Flagelloscypha sp. PMI_526]
MNHELVLNSVNDEHAAVILDLDPKGGYSGADMPVYISNALAHLYADPAVKTVISRSKHLEDIKPGLYYLEALERVAAPHYIPTNYDIQVCRRETVLIKCLCTYGELRYFIWDMQGHYGQPRRWIRCCEKITAIFFVVPLSSYDEIDPCSTMNGIEQSQVAFDQMCNSPSFADVPIVLLFNKLDLLAEKLPHSPLAQYFPEFTGDANYEEACNFFRDMFLPLNKNAKRDIYPYFTNAGRDYKQFKYIWTTLQGHLVEEHMRKHNLLP